VAALTDPVGAFGHPHQRSFDGCQLMHDLIVDGDIGESLDGDVRALADALAERDAAARHVGTGAQRRGAMVELVAQVTENSDELVRPRRFGIGLGSRRRWHAIDCTADGRGDRLRQSYDETIPGVQEV
jgi:hypothetical protein